MEFTGTWNTKIPYKRHLKSKAWSHTYFIYHPRNINCHNWTSVGEWPRALGGDYGAEIVDAWVGELPRVVAMAVTRVAGEAG